MRRSVPQQLTSCIKEGWGKQTSNKFETSEQFIPHQHFKIEGLTLLQNTIQKGNYPVGIYLFNDNNRNTRTRCEICSMLTMKTPERCQWRRSGVFILNFELISHLVLVFLLLTLSR